MFHVLLMLIIPLIIAGFVFFKYKRRITWKEFLLQLAVQCIIIVCAFFIARAASLWSVENWNGHIVKKRAGTVSCCHCHQECNGRDSKGNCTSYRTVCSHALDNYYLLDISTGDTVGESCTPSGTPRWYRDAYIGESASVPRIYTNYLKADPDSLIHHGANEALVNSIPKFPEVHSYYKVSKVVTHGVRAQKGLQPALMKLNDEFGSKKQIDVVFLLTKSNRKPNAYAAAVESAWLYGPKNSLIVILGMDGPKIRWARVVTISKVERLKINLRDELPGHTALEAVSVLRDHIGEWHRVSLSEYEYLAAHAKPENWMLVLLYILSFKISFGLSWYMRENDVFGDERWLNQDLY